MVADFDSRGIWWTAWSVVKPLLIGCRGFTPDLVLLDMLMPGITGREVLIKIKSTKQLAEVPVIVVSALDDQGGDCSASVWARRITFPRHSTPPC
ncbi:MAG: response regulator [Verrucomicrobiales bacterium]